MSDNAKVYTSTSYKCENCGSAYVYNADEGNLTCSHCGSVKDLEKTVIVKELPFDKSVVNDSCQWMGTKNIHCEDCGANFVAQNNDTSMTCPFCGRHHIIYVDEIPGLKPNGIVPFEIGYKKAKEVFLKWVKSRKMAPRSFKNLAHEKECVGTYIPVFTFDSDTTTRYNLVYETAHTRTVGSGKNQRTETYYTRHSKSGFIDCSFDDIKIEASSRIEQSKFDRIASFNTNVASEYHDQFLCGYICERYSESISQSWNDACYHMDARIKKNVISRYSGVDRVVSYDADTKYMNNTYKYVLVPIYFVNYFFKDKDYQCRINGVNGTINGESPVSVGKVLAIVFSILAVIAAIVILVLLNQ